MSMIKEFKEFALKGNVLDLAVAVIIGAAFGTIITSFIGDVVMPIVGLAGKVDFSKAVIELRPSVAAVTDASGKVISEAIPANNLRYGAFITNTINFLILAFCIFIVVKVFNTARKKFEAQPKPAPAVPPAPTKEQVLLTEIRDLLARR